MAELVALPVLLGVGDVFLGILDLTCQHRAIEIIEESALAIGVSVEPGAGPRAARAVSAEAVPTLA